jgi:pectate lyase
MSGAGFLLSNVTNVIIHNLILSKAVVEDSITINASDLVWIDHCDLSSDGTASYDGLIDVAHGSDFVTISWCVFHDHRLVSLVGHSATPSDPLEDPGHLTVTYHHNWFRGTQFYNPKVRFGTAHIFNNYYDFVAGDDAKGIVSQLGAQVLVEGNFFRNVEIPMSTVDNESESDPSKEGYILQRQNRYEGISEPVITKIGTWTPSPSDYSYSLDAAETVPAVVTACAGPLFQ